MKTCKNEKKETEEEEKKYRKTCKQLSKIREEMPSTLIVIVKLLEIVRTDFVKGIEGNQVSNQTIYLTLVLLALERSI